MRTSGMVPSTSSSASSDLIHQVPLYPISSSTEYCVDHGKSLGSMNMEDFLQNIYAENSPFITDCEAGDATVDRMIDQNMKRNGSNGTQRSVEDMWRDISSSDRKIGGEGMGLVGMTLEDYLARAGVVGEEAVGVRVATSPRFKPKGAQTGGVMDSVGLSGPYGQQQKTEEVPIVGFGSELVEAGGDVVGTRGRGKIRGLAQDQTEKVAQQRQKRMIKNRESAARSRERKQAYTVELETLVIKLEKENSSLKHEQEERRRNRLKQLKEDRIPVVERKKQRHLRRTLSMQW